MSTSLSFLRSLRSLSLIAVLAGALLASPGTAAAGDAPGSLDEATAVPQEQLVPAEAALQREAEAEAEPLSHGYCGSFNSYEYGSGYYFRVPSTGGSTHCIMGRGAQSNAVEVLQYSLVNCHGLSTGGLDGIYGPSTESAVRSVQSAAGIAVDGVYGPQTRNAVSWAIYPAGSWSVVGCR